MYLLHDNIVIYYWNVSINKDYWEKMILFQKYDDVLDSTTFSL